MKTKQLEMIIRNLDKYSFDEVRMMMDLEERIILLLLSVTDSRIRNLLYDLACDKDILENRTQEEHLQLMDKVVNEKDEEKRKVLYDLAYNKNILENRTQEEHLLLIDKAEKMLDELVDIYDDKERDQFYDLFYDLIDGKIILTNRTQKQQLQLIEKI